MGLSRTQHAMAVSRTRHTSRHSTAVRAVAPNTGSSVALPPPPSFDETPPTTAGHAPETPTKRRSALGVPDTVSPPPKRWRSGTLHPETLVLTTASPTTGKARRLQPQCLQARRCDFGVQVSFVPCAHFADFEANRRDRFEVIVKRPRLASSTGDGDDLW